MTPEDHGIQTIGHLVDELMSKHGDAIGIKILGYPTSWIHRKTELDAIEHTLKP